MPYRTKSGLRIITEDAIDDSDSIGIVEQIDNKETGLILVASNSVLKPNPDGSAEFTIKEQHPFFRLEGEIDFSDFAITDRDQRCIQSVLIRYEMIQRATANMQGFSPKLKDLGISENAVKFVSSPPRIVVDALALYMRPFSSEKEDCFIGKLLNLSFLSKSDNFRRWKKNEMSRWNNAVLGGIYSIEYKGEKIDTEALLHRFFNLMLFHDKPKKKEDTRSIEEIVSIFQTYSRCYDFFCDVLARQAMIIREIINEYGRMFKISINDKIIQLPDPFNDPDPDYIITNFVPLSRENDV